MKKTLTILVTAMAVVLFVAGGSWAQSPVRFSPSAPGKAEVDQLKVAPFASRPLSSLLQSGGGGWAEQKAHPIAYPFGAKLISLDFGKSSSVRMKSVTKVSSVGDPVDMNAALNAGADYLRHAQSDVTEDNAGNGSSDTDNNDGGWDWVLTAPAFTHSTNASPPNIYGATAMGLYYAYLRSSTASWMTAMQDVATKMVNAGTTDIRTARDIIFLMRFQDLPGVTANIYKDAAKAKFDARIAEKGSATAFAQSIRDTRGVTQGLKNGIIPWDIGAYVVAAQMLKSRYPSDSYDYHQAAVDMAEVLYQDSYNNSPGYFKPTGGQNDGWDPTYANKNYYWYTLGITGLVDAFFSANVHTAEIPALITILNACSYSGGAFSYCYGANSNDEDWQTTAYAVMSLALVDQTTHQSRISHACYWLGATQDVSSGAWIYTDNTHYPEVGGECTTALYFGQNASTVWVDAAYTSSSCGGHLWGYDAFATLQSGIGGVASAGTVNVAAGTYTETGQIVIGKDVSIIGVNKTATIIKINQNTSNSGDAKGWFLVNDGFTLNLSNVTLDGTGYKVFQGIRHKGKGTIDNCIFTEIKYNESGPDYAGTAIVAFGSPAMNVNITNCTFSQIGRVGVLFFGTGITSSTFSGNTYTGKGSGNWLDYGVEVGAGAKVAIMACTISNDKGVASVDGSTSAGILVTTYYGTGTQATITGNSVADNTEGVAVGYDASDASTVTARFNNILNNTGNGLSTTNSLVNAEFNWWGSTAGPLDDSDDRSSGGLYNNGGIASGRVSDKVDYDPWIGKAGSSNPGAGPLTLPLFAAAGHSVIKIGGTEDIDLVFLGNNFKGCTAVITFVGTVVHFVSVTPNAVLGTGGFAQYHDLNQTTGTVTIDIARLESGMLNNPGTIATIRFEGVGSGTSPVTISSVQVRDENNNPVTVGTVLNEEIIVDGTAPTMEAIAEAQGQYYKVAPSFTNFGFDDETALDKAEYKVDGGSWTELFSDAMGTEWNNDNWTLPDFGGLSDNASHTIYFRVTDDAGNVNGEGAPELNTYSWQFYKDVSAPAAVTGVTATPGGSVDLTWTLVPHSNSFEFDKLEIRRNAWGAYPSYSGSAPSYPSNTEGTLVTTIYDGAQTSYRDPISGLATATRDIYYYQLFVYDKAGNVSPVNASAQARATNYLLGDIAAATPPPPYDNTVNFNDLNPWSIAYGMKQGDLGYVPEYDFGPTDNNSRFGIPQPWEIKGSATVAYQIQFEDLMIFAMNYTKVLLKTSPPAEGTRAEHLALELRGQMTGSEGSKELLVTLHLSNDGEQVKGSSVVLSYNPASMSVEGVSSGALFGIVGQTAFFYHKESEGKVQIDAAALGIDNAVEYSGDIAVIRFKALKSGDYNVSFDDVTLRDAHNVDLKPQCGGLTFAAVGKPTAYDVSQNYPNPFNPTTTIAYQVPEAAHVTLEVYNVLGERVATLVDEQQSAGYYRVEWNGKDSGQRSVSSGVYYYKMSAGQFMSIKKMLLVK